MKITLKQLAVFNAVYCSGTTVQAAERLALSQSAISSALHELEKLLNVKLFERNGKKLVITPAARRLYPQAAAVLMQVEEMEEAFSSGKLQLNIGASTTIGNYLLPELISAFTRRYPNIEIILHVHNTREVCEGLRDFAYDLGFIEGDNLFDELIAEKWRQDELTLFAATHSQFVDDQTDTVSMSQLKKLPLVLREQGSGTRETIERLILRDVSHPHILQLSHSEAIRQAVIHDFGIGCLSKYVLEDALKLGKIRYLTLTGKPLYRTLWLVKHHNKYLSDGLQAFLQFCRDYQ
ncbi:LysR family transcriptional regulator [Pasteurellaceae bacterium LIM206]|nr:LysR family transcriptional regulator [Pasteurellaceae bacterium LIM206]